MRFAVVAPLVLCWSVPPVAAQTSDTGPAISKEVIPVQETGPSLDERGRATAGQGGTARGFLGGEPPAATKSFVLPTVEFDPSPDFPDLRAAIDGAVAAAVQAGAPSTTESNKGQVPVESQYGLVIDTLGELLSPKSIASDFVHLGSKDNLLILGTGLAAAGMANAFGADEATYRHFAAEESAPPPNASSVLDAIGSAEFLYPTVIGTYFLGRALGKPKVRSTGAKLTQGLLMTGVIVTLTKQLTGRERPDYRSASSLPSGHTADFFTIATILQHDYGWKVGVPAYAVAGLMGVSRLDANRHFLSDIIVGATIGVVVGHTVGGRLDRQGMQVGVIGAPDGGVGVGVAMDLSMLAGHFSGFR